MRDGAIKMTFNPRPAYTENSSDAFRPLASLGTMASPQKFNLSGSAAFFDNFKFFFGGNALIRKFKS
jgi:hypothetical protein